MIDLEPTLVTLAKNGCFVESDIEVPGMGVFMSATVTITRFNRTAKYEFGKHEPFKKGKWLWEIGMQKYVANEIQVFTDDLESGLFTSANLLNDPKYPFMFARLLSCELYDQVSDAFAEFAGKF